MSSPPTARALGSPCLCKPVRSHRIHQPMSRTLSRPSKPDNGTASKSRKNSGGKGPEKGNGDLIKHPIFDELQFPTDPDNLYRQTVSSMLQAADLMNLPHELKIILAQ